MGKGDRSSARREKIKEQQEAERKREHRKKIITYVTVGVVAVGAVAAGWLYNMMRSRPEEALAAAAPITVQPEGPVTMAAAGVDKPVVDIYEDFQCPACKQLEITSGPTFKNLASEGKAKIVYHPITIFGEEPTKGNSLRAGAASRCVSNGSQWIAYHDKLFKKQPSESVEGYKLEDLVTWGKEVGVTDPAFEQCVKTLKYANAQVLYSQKVNKEQNLTGTPTVKVNGKKLDNSVIFAPSDLRSAILDAAK
ncbi:DsbA family protein [Nonomuraea longicatena]|uniref:Thioredoxin domain-containing protein n=1 Tax=Nonomuraea longicatena TaxID=83682 RepID=A0ABN1P8L2_9ACTN